MAPLCHYEMTQDSWDKQAAQGSLTYLGKCSMNIKYAVSHQACRGKPILSVATIRMPTVNISWSKWSCAIQTSWEHPTDLQRPLDGVLRRNTCEKTTCKHQSVESLSLNSWAGWSRGYSTVNSAVHHDERKSSYNDDKSKLWRFQERYWSDNIAYKVPKELQNYYIRVLQKEQGPGTVLPKAIPALRTSIKEFVVESAGTGCWLLRAAWKKVALTPLTWFCATMYVKTTLDLRLHLNTQCSMLPTGALQSAQTALHCSCEHTETRPVTHGSATYRNTDCQESSEEHSEEAPLASEETSVRGVQHMAVLTPTRWAPVWQQWAPSSARLLQAHLEAFCESVTAQPLSGPLLPAWSIAPELYNYPGRAALDARKYCCWAPVWQDSKVTVSRQQGLTRGKMKSRVESLRKHKEK